MIKRAKEEKTIIILHGWGSSPDRWDEVKKNLKGFRVFVPYLPGFNPKNPLTFPYTLKDYTDWLKIYIEKNNISNPVLVGHSNGGRIAVHYTATNESSISKLILVGSAGVQNTQPLFKLKKLLFKKIAKTGKFILTLGPYQQVGQKILYKLAGESDYLNASPTMKKTMQNMLTYDILEDLAKIQCPTLCIWGKFDRSTPLWMGKIITNGIQNAQLKVMNAGHNLHRENPKELSNVITSFVSL